MTADINVEAKKAERRSLQQVNVRSFESMTSGGLLRRSASTLQINIGLTCNLACRHCHVESSPARVETMPRFVADRLIYIAKNSMPHLKTVDITGGAPEMHEQFRYLVEQMYGLGLSIIDRCNLAILHDDPTLLEFLAAHYVQVVASLPCYSKKNVEEQRGDGVFDSSIRALQMLNSKGYGVDVNKQLNLVYNPIGPTLPPDQLELEKDYKQRLKEDFGVVFNNLICITNMPIKRFADDLLIRRPGNENGQQLQDYMDLLVQSFNMDTMNNVMCRDMVHVSWDGLIHDCDFNYALEMPSSISSHQKKPLSIFDIDSLSEMIDERIATEKHCYGCTAGKGSSCGGSLI